jgi:hypothetical protein
LVSFLDVGPFGEEGGIGVGELAVADMLCMLERVVFADDLVGAEVCGLEETWFTSD